MFIQPYILFNCQTTIGNLLILISGLPGTIEKTHCTQKLWQAMEKHAAPGGGYRGNGTEPTVKTGPTLKSELKAPSQLKILQRVTRSV